RRATRWAPTRCRTAEGLGQPPPAWALTASDSLIQGNGVVGLVRPASYAGSVTVDDFTVVLPGITESFDTTATGSLPAGWVQWSTGSPTFAVSTDRKSTRLNSSH